MLLWIRGQTGKQKIEYQKCRRGCCRRAAVLFAFTDTADFEKVCGVFYAQIQKRGAAALYFTGGKDRAYEILMQGKGLVLIGTIEIAENQGICSSGEEVHGYAGT